MKNIKKLLASIMVTALAFSSVSCSMIEKTPEAIGKTVYAKVGDEEITRADVDKVIKYQLDQYKAQYGDNYEEDATAKEELVKLRTQAVNSMVDNKVMVKKAEELKLISDEDLEKQIKSGRENYVTQFGSEEKLQEAMKSEEITEEDLTNMIKEGILVTKAKEYMSKDIKASDEDIKKYYDENKASFERGPGATVAHILVEDEAKAKEISEKAKNGGDFAKLAKENGTDGTATTGGTLGYIEYDTEQYDADFMTGVKKLGEGEISDPVKTQFGYHIIKVTGIDKKGGTPSLEEVKSTIATTLENTKKQEAMTKTLEEWKKELNVKVYEDRI